MTFNVTLIPSDGARLFLHRSTHPHQVVAPCVLPRFLVMFPGQVSWPCCWPPRRAARLAALLAPLNVAASRSRLSSDWIHSRQTRATPLDAEAHPHPIAWYLVSTWGEPDYRITRMEEGHIWSPMGRRHAI